MFNYEWSTTWTKLSGNKTQHPFFCPDNQLKVQEVSQNETVFRNQALQVTRGHQIPPTFSSLLIKAGK